MNPGAPWDKASNNGDPIISFIFCLQEKFPLKMYRFDKKI